MIINADLLDALAAGAAEERERIRRVMALPAARGREGAALQLALSDGITTDGIKSCLETFPAGPVPTFNTRPLFAPRHLRLATCRDLEGEKHAVFG